MCSPQRTSRQITLWFPGALRIIEGAQGGPCQVSCGGCGHIDSQFILHFTTLFIFPLSCKPGKDQDYFILC
jgi:hypothetical protein